MELRPRLRTPSQCALTPFRSGDNYHRYSPGVLDIELTEAIEEESETQSHDLPRGLKARGILQKQQCVYCDFAIAVAPVTYKRSVRSPPSVTWLDMPQL